MTHRQKLQRHVAEYIHTIWGNWMRYILSVATKNDDGSITISSDHVIRWTRMLGTSFNSMSKVEIEPKMEMADKVLKIVHKHKIVEPEEKDPRVKSVILKYVEFCKNIKGFEPEIAWALEGSMVKKKLGKFTEVELEDQFDWFLNSEESQKLGASLRTCLSNYCFNKWLKDYRQDNNF